MISLGLQTSGKVGGTVFSLAMIAVVVITAFAFPEFAVIGYGALSILFLIAARFLIRMRGTAAILFNAYAGLEVDNKTHFGLMLARFSCEGVEYGLDIGAVEVANGYIHFDGVQTWFALSGNQVRTAKTAHDLELKADPRFHVKFEQLSIPSRPLRPLLARRFDLFALASGPVLKGGPRPETVVRRFPMQADPRTVGRRRVYAWLGVLETFSSNQMLFLLFGSLITHDVTPILLGTTMPIALGLAYLMNRKELQILKSLHQESALERP